MPRWAAAAFRLPCSAIDTSRRSVARSRSGVIGRADSPCRSCSLPDIGVPPDGGDMTSIATPRTELRTAALTLAVAAIAVAASAVVPLLGPLLLALAAGAVVANSPLAGVVADHARVTKLLLRCGVVLLGLRIAGADLVAVGPEGAVVVVATVVCTYVATQRLGRRLGLDRDLVTLIAAGFSICGAAAVAAVNDAVRARERDVGVAVALVTLFGSAMIALVPVLGRT
ncbi:MAG: putative sulfate exporter family transporter, partial [Actinomycetales bacterium]